MNRQLQELSIELTNECTLRCIHCSSGSAPVKGPRELLHSKILSLLLEARQLGATVLSFSGGNPLLYDAIIDLCYAAMDLNYEKLLLYTTGHNRRGDSVYEHPNIRKLIYVPGITWVFSLHSHIHHVNDRIMGVDGALEDIENSIMWLRDMDNEVEIHMVPMLPNFMDISRVRNLCGELDVKRMSLLRFVPQTRGLENISNLDMNKAEFVVMQHIIEEEMLREHPVQLRAGCPIDFRHTIGVLPGKPKLCHAGDDLMLVRPTGAVHPCAAWKSLPSDSNVHDSSLAEIWETSKVFNAIRDFKAAGYLEVSGCASCVYLESCKTGCPAQRLHADGKHMEDLVLSQHSDPLCPLGS